MAINFESLPTNKPVILATKGTYFAKIDKADMVKPKTPGKPDYLNLQLSLADKNHKSAGKLFDILTESDSQLPRYKLGRFITALKLPLTEFELKDLAKIIVGKEFLVDVTVQENEGYAPRNVVDALTNEIYYPLEEADKIFNLSDEHFDAEDAAPDATLEEDDY